MLIVPVLFALAFWSIIRTALPRPYAYSAPDCGVLQVRGRGGFFTATGARLFGSALWGAGEVVRLD